MAVLKHNKDSILYLNTNCHGNEQIYWLTDKFWTLKLTQITVKMTITLLYKQRLSKNRSQERVFISKQIYVCYSPAREGRIGKNCARGLEYGPRPQAVLETEGTVFPNTDRPRPVNNIFIYFLILFSTKTGKVMFLFYTWSHQRVNKCTIKWIGQEYFYTVWSFAFKSHETALYFFILFL